MIYLGLGIISSMLVSALMRVSEKYSKNKTSMLAVGYLVCTLLAGMFTGFSNFISGEDGMGMVIGMGALNGLFYLGGFVLLQWNIGRNGVVLPATFLKLGVIVPTLLSILAFGEELNIAQFAGLLAAVAAIVLIQGGGKKGEVQSVAGLLVLLIFGGAGDAMSKVFEELGPAALKNQFLLYTFLSAFVLCVILCLVRREKLGLMDIAFGAAISVPNYFSSRFLLLSLSEVPAVVAFPSYSVGTIVLISIVGALVFKEKLSRRKIAALGIILAALVLLNV